MGGSGTHRIRYVMEKVPQEDACLRLAERPWEAGRLRSLAAAAGAGKEGLDLNDIDIRDLKVRDSIQPVFGRSNEGYAAGLRDAIGKLSCVDEYVGVCGGGDQHLFLLSLLQRNNALRKVTLVDYDVGQLLNFRDIAEIYNTRDGDDYVSAITAVDLEGWVDWKDERSNWRLLKPEISGGLRIDGVLCDLTEYAQGIRERGAYFLYFSNVLFGHATAELSRDCLAGLLANEAILPGSAVVMMTPSVSYSVMLRKESEVAFGVAFSENEKLRQGSRADANTICMALRKG